MAYDEKLADRLREALASQNKVIEKRMFSGVAFLVNGKMCMNVSHDKIMCRFDPVRFEEVSLRTGYEPMIMKGKQLKGYCYVSEDGFRKPKDFDFWVDLCLDYNGKAKASSKAKKRSATIKLRKTSSKRRE